MNRSELIENIASVYPQLSKQDVELSVRLLQQAIMKGLEQGRRVEVRGFGRFDRLYRPARRARNPKTGDSVFLKERWVPHFKPGKELRERIDASTAVIAIENGVKDDKSLG